MTYYLINSKTDEMKIIVEKAIAKQIMMIVNGTETEPEPEPEKKRGRKKADADEPEKKKRDSKESGQTLNGIGYRETVYLVKRDGSIVKGKVFQILNGDTFRVAFEDEDGNKKYANGKNAFLDKADAKAFVKGGMVETGGKKPGKKKEVEPEPEPEKKRGKKKDKEEEPEPEKKGKKKGKRCGNCALFQTDGCSYDTFPNEEPCGDYERK